MPPLESSLAPPPVELIAAGLPSIFPGAVVVDRELQLGAGGGTVDLAAVDGEGRLLLVCQVRGDGPEAVVLTLDALAFAQKNLPLLARHFHGAGLDPTLTPLVVLVAEHFEPLLLTRLGGLDPTVLACLEIRQVASRERAQTYLVPVVPSAGPKASRPASRPADFLQHLGPDVRMLGERLLERLARIDEDLEATSSGREMRFSLEGQAICALHAQPDLLEARVVPDGRSFRISTRASADAFLEEVLQRTLELFEPREPRARPAPHEAAPDPLDHAEALLTPEEIEAFRMMG